MKSYKEVKSKIDTGLAIKSRPKMLTPQVKQIPLTDRPSTPNIRLRPPPGGTDSINQKIP